MTRPTKILMLLAAAAASPAATPAAVASTAKVEGSVVRYTADPGESNDVAVDRDGGEFTIDDFGVLNPTVEAPCVLAGSRVRCPAAGITSIRVELGDGDDLAVMFDSASVLFDGGDGRDLLTGGPGADDLFGGPGIDDLEGGDGNDVLDGGDGDDLLEPDPTAGGGNDTLRGGPGDDTLDAGVAGNGRDVFSGGPHTDRVSFARRSAPVSLSLNNVADDGESGEGDSIAFDVEDLTGGHADDTITGNDVANLLRGGAGSDVISGGGGNDQLEGGGSDPGNDTLDGGAGADRIIAGPGDDLVAGGDGNDDLRGSGGSDTMLGGGGNDRMLGSEGIDTLSGGPGDDELDGAGRLIGADGADVLNGDDGNDRLSGGPGDDRLDGGLGADSLVGNEGRDSAGYELRAVAVSVSLDATANDGEPGEGDDVAGDVEDLAAGAADDTIVGDAGPNGLVAGRGEDDIEGGAGTDVIDAGSGAPGGGTPDSGDVVRSRDGTPDRVSCRAGQDYVIADPQDIFPDGDCESIDRGERRPAVGRSAVMTPVRGQLGFSPTGIRRSFAVRGKGPLTLPLGSIVDASKGSVRVTGSAGRGTRIQRGTFQDGAFAIEEVGSATRPITEIVLKGGSFRACRRAAAGDARSIARGSRRRVRRVRGNARGRFRTRGRYSSATVRGTRWVTEDRCDGTLTRVERGSVLVTDLVRRRRICLRTGDTYLSTPRRAKPRLRRSRRGSSRPGC